MDARLDPAKFAGLTEGDAHVVRNAGGRASEDAIRSLVISHKLLGTREWLVVHHTDCGMQAFTGEVMRDLLSRSLETAMFDGKEWRDTGKGPGSSEGEFVNWLTIRDQAKSVCADVGRLRAHPLVPRAVAVHGDIYDGKTGRLLEVPDRKTSGKRLESDPGDLVAGRRGISTEPWIHWGNGLDGCALGELEDSRRLRSRDVCGLSPGAGEGSGGFPSIRE